mmetsp:Transcript_4073/g.8204  ORF Transcript_4073/g.8204 Transcript_4073/m.8204 type:complete len:228 (-) Transcript_4073:562-1245(-)
MQGQQNFGFLGIVNFVFVEFRQGPNGHATGVHDFILEHFYGILQDCGRSIGAFQYDFQLSIGGHRGGLFRSVKVSLRHVCDVCAAGLGPNAHAVRILLRVGLDGWRHASIGIPFAQDGIDGRSGYFVVPLLNVHFLVILWSPRIEGYIVSLGTQFCNTILQLCNGGTDIGQFDNGTIGFECLVSQKGQIVGHSLFVVQPFGKGCQDTSGDTNINGHNIDIGQSRELA